jgi:NADH:ubiquinone oxidoreductase subunit E/ActR/RegA family two-component response regulator
MNPVQEAVRTVDRPWPQILLLEDEASVAKGLKMILDEEGYSAVDLAMTGRSALDTFRQKEVDLLIADLRLPDIDGLEVIRQVKHDRPDTGVIVITGYSTVNSAVTAMKLGAADYLSKPFGEDEFVSAVKGALVLQAEPRAESEHSIPAPEPRTAPLEPTLHLIREDPAGIDRLMAELQVKFAGTPDEVIPMLQMVQGRLGYLPENALEEIARLTGRPAAAIFGTATFYEQFRLAPVGRHIIRVCRGTACHVKGSDRILREIQSRFDLSPGETSPDRQFTLETVACFGSCAIAPVVVVDDSVKGRMNPASTCECLAGVRKHEGETAPSHPETN